MRRVTHLHKNFFFTRLWYLPSLPIVNFVIIAFDDVYALTPISPKPSAEEMTSLYMCALGFMTFAEVTERHSLNRERANVFRMRVQRLRNSGEGTCTGSTNCEKSPFQKQQRIDPDF